MNNFNTVFKRESKIIAGADISGNDLATFAKNNSLKINQFKLNLDKNKKHVVVVGGGMSAEREVSYMSSDGIVKSLLELGHNVTFVDMGADIALVLMQLKPDIVFNALHGTFGEDGCLPGMLNIMRIPYTGCGVLASSLAFDKRKSYEIFRANGIKLADSKIIYKSDNITSDPIKRPYVIKPISQGSSVGVEIIFTEDDFSFADYDFPYGDEIIVEQYIEGKEIQVAVLGSKVLGALEIKLLKNKRFYDYETKYTEGFAEHILPAPIPEQSYKKLAKITEHACQLFYCSGMVRAEFIYCPKTDEFYMLEINTHPGMTPLSICPEIAAFNGIGYTDLVAGILSEAKYEG